MALKRIAILASGRGSNFSAIANAIQTKKIPNAKIVGLMCNKPEAPVIQEAKLRGIPTFIIPSNEFKAGVKFDRAAYEERLLECLLGLHPDFICLAGYMLLLGPRIIQSFPEKILNIHPSLLPKFKGLRAQKQALDAGEKETGCTVHLVTEELDAGKTLVQRKTLIEPGDTEESLSLRLLNLEHEAYTEALRALCGS